MINCRLILITLAGGIIAACSGSSGPDITDDDIAMNNRGVALMGYFDYPGAHAVFSELVERQPEWHEARTNLAIAFMNRQEPGDEQLALDELAVVLAELPEDARANYVSGLLQLYVGNVEAATAHFQTVLAADPGDAYAHYYLGQCRQRSGDNDAALQSYRRAIDEDPYLRSAYYSASQVLQQGGDSKAATEQLNLFQRFASNPRARLAEFKYTRMGPKSLAMTADPAIPPAPPAARPPGPLFDAASVLAALDVEWPDAHITTVDIDNDGALDIFVAGSKGNRLIASSGNEYRVADTQPFAGIDQINAVAWGDMDNNGFVDVYLCRNGDNQLWYQESAGNWTLSGAAGSRSRCNDVALVDADHDGDLDIVIANGDAPDDLLNNNRDGSFRSLAKEIGQTTASATRRIITADIDADRDVDLVFLRDTPPHVALINDRLWSYQSAKGIDDFLDTSLQAVTIADLNADGWVEFTGIDNNQDLVSWSRNDAGAMESTIVIEGAADVGESVDLFAQDFTGDGRLELTVLTSSGYRVFGSTTDLKGFEIAAATGITSPAIPINLSASKGPSLVTLDAGTGELRELGPGAGRLNFVSFTVSGDHDESETMRSNASGIGTQIAIRNGSRWTLTDTYKHNAARGQSLQPVSVGIGGDSRADFIEMQWSDGVYQTELDVESGDVHHFAETERQLSSCPVLFVWDGEKYDFVTDLLGVGGLGGFVEPGVAGTPRPWERLAIAPGTLAERDGTLAFKLTEPMQENMYLDSVRVETYDLPHGWQIVVDERMGTGAPSVTGRTLFYRDTLTPVAAVDSNGNDVLDKVATKDNEAMSPGTIDRRFLGLLTETESVTIEFDQPITEMSSSRLPILVADSWVEYPYSQTAFSAWQAGLQYQSATLEARDVEGNWHMVHENFGYPAGMPREMTLPLARLPAGASTLRLSWNRELYWDRFYIAYAEPPPPETKHTAHEPRMARLAKTGFAKRSTFEQRRPHYDYQQRVPFWDTEYSTGFYTRLGEMTELVTDTDDAVAIIGPGEEVHFEFELAPAENALNRWYVLETRGWAKDKDLYTRDGETVGPLPRSGAIVDEKRRDELHEQYNVRFQAGR